MSCPCRRGNPVTRAKVELGQRLFEDPALSGDGSTSCLTCHLPEHGFAAPEPLGPVCPSQTERRNSPTRVNVAYNLPLAYGDEQITPAHVGNAISSFERTLAFEDAPIDRYTLMTGLRRSGPPMVAVGTRISPRPTGSPETVTRLRLPQNVACRFPALRSSKLDSQHNECLELPVRNCEAWSL